MATDLGTSTVATPRIDRQFVDPGTGMLTQNAYALLYGLIRRTGGVVGDVIDTAGIRSALVGLGDDVASMQAGPLPAGSAPTQGEDPHGRIEALEATVEALRTAIHDLQQGRTP